MHAPDYIRRRPSCLSHSLARYQKGGNITVSEVYFYYYDTLMDEIMSLYEDDLHTVLRPDVTQAVIDALRVLWPT